MEDKFVKAKRIILFVAVCILIVAIVAGSLVLFSRGRGERKSKWGGADVADILDDSVPEDYLLPFGLGATVSYSGPDNWYAAASLASGLPVWKEVERRTGVKFEWEVLQSDQWNISMKTKINSGRSLPDMLGLPNWQDADIDKYASEYVILPLNELINKYAPNIKRILKENPTIRKQMTASDGNIYSIDEFFECNEYYNSVIIREDWLLACGYERGWVPKTKDEFVEVMRKFKQKNSELTNSTQYNIIPLGAARGDLYDIFCSGFGLSAPLQDTVVDGAGKVSYQRASEGYGKFLDWMHLLYVDGLLYGDYQAANTTAFERLIIQNRIGITVAAGDTMDRYNAMLASNGIDGKYIIINPPVDDDGNLTLVKRIQLGGQIGISYDCKDPVTCIRLMDYLWANNEGVLLTHYGIEGYSYEYADDGSIRFTDFVTNNPDGLDKASALRSIGAWGPLFDHQTLQFMSDLYPAQANEYHAANMAAGVYVEPYPKILPTGEETAKMGSYAADLTTYQEEYHIKRILGTTSVSYSDYIKEMERLGLREYERLRQEQYERFSKL